MARKENAMMEGGGSSPGKAAPREQKLAPEPAEQFFLRLLFNIEHETVDRVVLPRNRNPIIKLRVPNAVIKLSPPLSRTRKMARKENAMARQWLERKMQ